jgi:hypothetical protein
MSKVESKKPACIDCIYFRADENNIGKQGQCRRYPPAPFPMQTRGLDPNTINVNVLSVSPLVQADYYCGEFRVLVQA